MLNPRRWLTQNAYFTMRYCYKWTCKFNSVLMSSKCGCIIQEFRTTKREFSLVSKNVSKLGRDRSYQKIYIGFYNTYLQSFLDDEKSTKSRWINHYMLRNRRGGSGIICQCTTCDLWRSMYYGPRRNFRVLEVTFSLEFALVGLWLRIEC